MWLIIISSLMIKEGPKAQEVMQVAHLERQMGPPPPMLSASKPKLLAISFFLPTWLVPGLRW